MDIFVRCPLSFLHSYFNIPTALSLQNEGVLDLIFSLVKVCEGAKWIEQIGETAFNIRKSRVLEYEGMVRPTRSSLTFILTPVTKE